MKKAGQNSLTIGNKGAKRLSKKQVEFNRLSAKIVSLREEIMQLKGRMHQHIEEVRLHIGPAQATVAEAELRLAFALEEACLAQKFPKSVQSEIATAIVGLCLHAFRHLEPHVPGQALFNRWIQFNREPKPQVRAHEPVAEPEKAAGWEEQAYQGYQEADDWKWRQEQQSFGQSQRKGRSRAQTKIEEKRAAAEKAREQLKSRSLRSIYISVAKLIHPDMEIDPSKKADKEEEMKKLTAAYEKDDLTTLLQMEMDWIHQQNDHLDELADEKLGLYVGVLKEQMQQLTMEKKQIFWNPRFDNVRRYAVLKVDKASRQIRSEARELEREAGQLDKIIREMAGPDAVLTVKRFVGKFLSRLAFARSQATK